MIAYKIKLSFFFCFFFVFPLSSCHNSILPSNGEESLKSNSGAGSPLGAGRENIRPAVWQVRNDLIIRTHKFSETGSGRNKDIEVEKVTERKPLSFGTGFSISPELIVTNFHVITNIDGNTEITFNRDESINLDFFAQARLLRVSSIYDLALLQVEGDKKMDKWLSVKPSVSDPAGKPFFLFGYPDTRFVKLKLDFYEYANDSVVRFKRDDSAGQLSGASGGPVMDEEGFVAGVFHASSASSSAGQAAYASAIWTNALNDFLNGNGRDCSQITEEECVNQEWIYLEQNARAGNHSLARYELGLFGEYAKWRNKRDAFKSFTRNLAVFNSAMDDALTALDQYNENRSRNNYEDYLSAVEDLQEAEGNLNHSLNVLRQLQEELKI